MDWFRHRYATGIEALTVRRALVVGSIFAVSTFVVGLIPKLSWEGQPMFLNVPALAWGVIAALLMLVYFLFEYAHRKRMETVPNARLSFNQDTGGIVQSPTK